MNRNRQAAGRFLNDYVWGPLLVAVLVATIGLLISFIVAASIREHHIGKQEDQQAFAALAALPDTVKAHFASPEHRRAMRGAIAALSKTERAFETEQTHGASQKIEDFFLVGAVPQPKEIDIHGLDDYGGDLVRFGVGAAIGFLGLVCFASFWIKSFDREERCADLPWQRPWPWIFAVAITAAAPWSIPVFLGSALLLRRDRRQKTAAFERLLEGRALLHANEAPLEQPRPAEDAAPQRQVPDVTVISKPSGPAQHTEASRRAWREIYSGSRLLAWSTKHEQLQRDVEDAREQLNRYGEDLAETQRELADAATRLNAHERHKPPSDEKQIAPEERVRYEEQFDRLVRMPSVTEVSVQKNAVIVLLENVAVEIRGRYYDLGDYRVRIRLNDADPWPDVRCIKRTRLNHHDGKGHPYFYDEEGGFCFGDQRKWAIEEKIATHDYLVALALVVEALHHVNPGQERYVTEPYPEVRYAGA